ncbi:MAG: glycosyltransferase family 2 protein [Muribaculaceae bacterium]|nr:glycosyltransferase family 2 protein [Muribaculaceae bacterium]
MNDLNVSIVTHSTPVEELVKAVGCVLRSSRVNRIDILDNSGTAIIEEYKKNLSGYEDKVRIKEIDNRGYGAGHNISIEDSIESNVCYHLVMNSDVWWKGDILSILCAEMDRRPEVGQLMPKVYYPDGALQLTARRLPTPYDVFAKRFLPSFITKNRINKYLLAEANHDIEINSPYLLGSFMLLRTDALKETGIFDERFFMYPEDIDLTRRLHRKYKTIYYPEVSIIHEHRAASRRNLRMLWIHSSNMIRYFNKWGWWIDPERRRMNKELDSAIRIISKDKLPLSRG